MASSAYQIIQIGTLKLTLPSFITAVCGLVIGAIVGVKINLITGLLVVAAAFVQAYTINCIVLGHCTTWAWILSSIYILYAAIMIILLFISLGKRIPLKTLSKKK
jgi:hypothetical protein